MIIIIFTCKNHKTSQFILGEKVFYKSVVLVFNVTAREYILFYSITFHTELNVRAYSNRVQYKFLST